VLRFSTTLTATTVDATGVDHGVMSLPKWNCKEMKFRDIHTFAYTSVKAHVPGLPMAMAMVMVV